MFDLAEVVKETVQTDWKDVLLEAEELLKKVGINLEKEFVEKFQEEIPFYPPVGLTFNAFNHFNISDLKVCIIGMDPYHGHGQAMGLSFSVFPDVKVPPSLRNIFKEMSSDLGIDTSERNGDLTYLTKQGVLLLNASLSVREKKAGSHRKHWKGYTDSLIEKISDRTEGVIFILWGNDAKKKGEPIDKSKHHVLEGVHPSPLAASRGFFGCKHFSKCNAILESHSKEPIDW